MKTRSDLAASGLHATLMRGLSLRCLICMLTGLKLNLLLGLLVGLLMSLAPATHAAQALQLDELMALLAQTRSGQASFVERRSVKGLDAPLVSTGTLSFAAPDRFVRNTVTPKAETLSVEGKIVTMTRNGRSRTMVIDAAPEVEAIVESVRGTLTGNAASLRLHFKPVVSGTTESWQLELLPLEPRLKSLLASVRLAGQRAQLLSVDMRMADGDSALMTISPTAAGAADAPALGSPGPAPIARP